MLNAALVSGIEIVNIRATTANTLNASQIAGLTAVNANQGAGTVLVTNLATGAAIGIKGNGTIAQGELAFAYATATAAITLNIADGVKQGAGDSVTAAATIAAGNATGTATTATINSTGAANVLDVVDLADASLTSVTVNAATNLTGAFLSEATDQVGTDGSVTISGAATSVVFTGAMDNTIKTINASGLTAGGLTATLGTLNTQTVTGGAGNDVITTSGTVLTTGSVNAGAGTDTLILGTNVADANTVSLAAKFTNFETLRLAGTFDASLIAGINTVQVTGASTITKLSAAQALALTVYSSANAGTGDAQSFALTTATGTSDVATITLGSGLTTSEAGDINGLTVTGFERVNLVATPGATAVAADRTSTIASFTGATLNNVTLTGTAFSLGNIATTVAVTIDGSALTGDGAATSLGLTVAGSAVAGSTITGSAVGDRFTIGAEGSTYNGADGNDIFTTTVAILAADGVTDLVLAGGVGTDTLTITGALTLTDNHFTNVTGMEKLATAATTVVSYTGFGAGAKTAFANGLTITSGTLANDAAYTVGAGLYDKAVTLTLVSSGDGATTADNIAITTGSAADTVTVTAASWVGHASTGGTIAVNTGSGVDTISVTIAGASVLATGIATITAGTGADVITSVGINATNASNQVYTMAAGDSLVSAYDSITGFDMANGTLFSSTLDFASVGLTAYVATAVAGNTAAELTAAVSAAGLVSFAGTKAAALTLAEKITAVQGLVITNAGDSALFTHGANSYVFNNNATADSLVELVGIAGTALITANATTASAIFIA